MSFSTECEVCGTSPINGGLPIFRTGGKGKGVNPHWRCQQHTEIELDQKTAEIVNIIENNGKENQCEV